MGHRPGHDKKLTALPQTPWLTSRAASKQEGETKGKGKGRERKKKKAARDKGEERAKKGAIAFVVGG